MQIRSVLQLNALPPNPSIERTRSGLRPPQRSPVPGFGISVVLDIDYSIHVRMDGAGAI